MRVALLGVGLIGGSIGLAARRRLGAHVVGWNRSPEALETALRNGAIDEAVASLDEIGDADVAIASVSVDALPRAVRELCDRLPGAVVSDVGSTKQALVEAVDRTHFIGGHPLAGAETTGVLHARENLFDGATWYLTPSERTPGVLYERLARFVAGIGAVPTAIGPAEHDRLMAAVSHLPHVVANLLVAQAADALGGETPPATGPSFRDATRVAGANPALWEQIYRANRVALGAQIDDLVARLGEVRGLLDADGDLGAWQARAAEQRAALLEVGLVGGAVREIRASVPNRPGVVAQIALALGRAGINIADMTLAPEPDDRTGVVGLWVGADDAERAIGLVAELGFPRGMSDAFFAPAGPLHGEAIAPADKSISHRAALLGAMSDGEVRICNYLHAEDTTSTLNAVRALGADVSVLSSGEVVVRGVGLDGARPPGGPIDVGNAGTLMRLLPGWLAALKGRSFELDGDASIRRRPVDRIAEPLARMGAVIEATDGRYPPLHVRGTALSAITYALPMASAQVKSCVLIAGLGADGTTTVTEPAPSRDHTERMLAGAGVEVRRDGPDVSLARAASLQAQSLTVPGDLSSAAFMVAAAVLVPGSRVLVRDVGVNWTRTGFLRILARMGAAVGGALEPVPAPGDAVATGEPICDLDVAFGPLRATTVEAEEVPLAIDELPLVALLGCFAEGETVVRGAQELRVKESDRIAGVVDGLRGLGATIEATEDGFVVTGAGWLRGGTIDARGDHRMAMLGAVAGLASREGVRVVGMEAAAVSYPGFEEDLARLG